MSREVSVVDSLQVRIGIIDSEYESHWGTYTLVSVVSMPLRFEPDCSYFESLNARSKAGNPVPALQGR